jgi:ATP-dependent Lon protease
MLLKPKTCTVTPISKGSYYELTTAWFNKQCQIKGLIPNYAHIQVKGNDIAAQKTQHQAIRSRISNEIKFQYAKKCTLNAQMYKLHLTNANEWQSIWNLILDSINTKLKKESDRHYELLHNKINMLLKRLMLAIKRKEINTLFIQEFVT